jgi:hypothetical protein
VPLTAVVVEEMREVLAPCPCAREEGNAGDDPFMATSTSSSRL